jgi:hypothetical protein
MFLIEFFCAGLLMEKKDYNILSFFVQYSFKHRPVLVPNNANEIKIVDSNFHPIC